MAVDSRLRFHLGGLAYVMQGTGFDAGPRWPPSLFSRLMLTELASELNFASCQVYNQGGMVAQAIAAAGLLGIKSPGMPESIY